MNTRRYKQYDNFDLITNYQNLYDAHTECRKGKLWKDSVAAYELRALESTLYLKYLLDSGKYTLNEYHCFTIKERGKERNIKSTHYKDRVVQKSLNDNIIVPAIQPGFCYENSASQRGKGTDFAINLLKRHLRKEVARHGAGGYILVGDFKSYFDSISHEILDEMYSSIFKDEKLLALIKMIHDSTPGDAGIPLGNQLSQNDALLVASPIDHYIKEVLHIKGYGRYMDDFYLIHHDKDFLKYCLSEIEQLAAERKLTLHPVKTKIVPITQGIDFLGFHYHVTSTGKVVMHIKSKFKARWRSKIRKHKKKVQEGVMSYEQARESFNSRYAHASRGNSYYLLRNMKLYFYTQFYDYLTDCEKYEYQKLSKEQKTRERKRRIKKNGETTE